MSGCSYSPRAEMNHWRMRMWSVVEKKVGKKVEKKVEKIVGKKVEKKVGKKVEKKVGKKVEKKVEREKIEPKIWMALTGLLRFY